MGSEWAKSPGRWTALHHTKGTEPWAARSWNTHTLLAWFVFIRPQLLLAGVHFHAWLTQPDYRFWTLLSFMHYFLFHQPASILWVLFFHVSHFQKESWSSCHLQSQGPGQCIEVWPRDMVYPGSVPREESLGKIKHFTSASTFFWSCRSWTSKEKLQLDLVSQSLAKMKTSEKVISVWAWELGIKWSFHFTEFSPFWFPWRFIY